MNKVDPYLSVSSSVDRLSSFCGGDLVEFSLLCIPAASYFLCSTNVASVNTKLSPPVCIKLCGLQEAGVWYSLTS